MSKIIRQKLGRKKLRFWAKMDLGDVPDHSKAPWSRVMPNVIVVGAVFTPSSFKNGMKLAIGVLGLESDGAFGELTVCGCIHHNEAGVHHNRFAIVFEGKGIRVAT
jgi:hypothetical protein